MHLVEERVCMRVKVFRIKAPHHAWILNERDFTVIYRGKLVKTYLLLKEKRLNQKTATLKTY